MNEILTKWVAALRSGEYKQAEGTLCDGEGYCCLGVLEHILDGQVETDDVDGQSYVLPLPSTGWLEEKGISKADMFDTGHSMWSLAEMNDDGVSFADIADLLEGK